MSEILKCLSVATKIETSGQSKINLCSKNGLFAGTKVCSFKGPLCPKNVFIFISEKLFIFGVLL
jgi:hypothetical protein